MRSASIHFIVHNNDPQAPGYFSTVLAEYMQGPVMLMGLPLDVWEATHSSSITGEADIGRNMGNGTRTGRGRT